YDCIWFPVCSTAAADLVRLPLEGSPLLLILSTIFTALWNSGWRKAKRRDRLLLQNTTTQWIRKKESAGRVGCVGFRKWRNTRAPGTRTMLRILLALSECSQPGGGCGPVFFLKKLIGPAPPTVLAAPAS